MMTNKPPKYSPFEARQKIKFWCDIQERAQQDVRDKLYQWGLHHDEVESMIADLITDNYLNEERFARAYVSGKFRIKKWGRNKIVNGLKFKKISNYCIRLALQEIDEEEYDQTIKYLVNKKSATIKISDAFLRKNKIAAYLIQRGFEPEMVWECINDHFSV